MDVGVIVDAIVQGKAERYVKETTDGIYMSKGAVMTSIIKNIPALRAQALELDADGNALMHSGKAHTRFIRWNCR